ncbi:MAG: hypothetical protein R3B47_19900 [Bacteroidia bacterium]
MLPARGADPKCEEILAKAYKQSPNAIALTLRAIDKGEAFTRRLRI